MKVNRNNWKLIIVCVLSMLIVTYVSCYKVVEGYEVGGGITAEDIVGDNVPSYSWEKDIVPNIIHQTAPTHKGKWDPSWVICQETWKQKFPDHRYIMWTDEDIDTFIRKTFPMFYPYFRAYPQNIYRVDAVRYFILYEYGGIYADMDYMVLKPFEHLIPNGMASIGESPHKYNEEYQNALMASPPRHPFWLCVIHEMVNKAHMNLQVLDATGPRAVSNAIVKAPYGMVHTLPKEQFNPLLQTISYSKVARSKLAIEQHLQSHIPNLENVYTVHLGTTSYEK